MQTIVQIEIAGSYPRAYLHQLCFYIGNAPLACNIRNQSVEVRDNRTIIRVTDLLDMTMHELERCDMRICEIWKQKPYVSGFRADVKAVKFIQGDDEISLPSFAFDEFELYPVRIPHVLKDLSVAQYRELAAFVIRQEKAENFRNSVENVH